MDFKLQYELDANDEITINCFCLLANVVATPVPGQDFPTDVALAWTPGDGFSEPVVCAFGDWGGTSYTHKLHSYAGQTLSFNSQIFSVPFVNIVPLIQYSGIMILVHVLHLLVLRRD